ncbi:MAG: hypothetical protein KC983_01170, partial [Phycisphaerales bacterium]|nr:hypothetical protein [Phycisphaerales bacterium]
SSAPAAVRLSDLTASGMRGPIGRGGRLDIVAVMASMSVLTPTPGLVIDCRQWIDPWAGLERSLAALQSL